MSRRFAIAALAATGLTLAMAGAAGAQASAGDEGTYFIKGGTVINPGGQRLTNTNILVRNNRIVDVGPSASAADAKVIDATGKFIYPGMIDANTGLGLSEIGSVQTMSFRSELGDFNPHIRALVGLNVESELLGVTRMNGVTTVIVTPAGGAISGQAAMINTAGWTWEDLSVVKSAGVVFSLPGSGGRGGRGGGGGGRGRGGASTNPNLAADFQQFMTESKAYVEARDAGSSKVDLIYEAMRPVFRKEVPALINANSDADIRNAIAFGERWGLKVVIMGGADAWRVRKLLAEKKVPVVLGPIQAAPTDTVPYDEIYAQPGLLNDAGVKFAFSTGAGSNSRHVAFHAALAMAYGLPADAALKALTIWPAEIFGADKEIGSVEKGKMANFFITTGDPMDLRTQVVGVFVKGRQLPPDDRHTRLYLKYKARPLPIKP